MRYRRLQRAAPVITALLGLGPLLAAPVAAQQTMDTGALTELSFEELMEVEVTSASKRKQALDDVAAALFVISRDDLRRSGANSIPEALRMVPGIQVSQLDANKWAVSARGFAGRFANKLLVLIDGRTVYSPAFSGVYWEQQNVVLDDVERIEVIRGPGATLWGANAVNGVVNIITRDSQKTLGGLALAGAGTENRATATLRYGARLGSGDAADTTARGYLTYDRHDDLVTRTGHAAGDAWDMAQGGFRLDSDFARGDWMTVQGGYSGNMAMVPIYRSSGGAFNNAAPVTSEAIGLAEFTFDSCTSGQVRVEFVGNPNPIIIPLQRITPAFPGC